MDKTNREICLLLFLVISFLSLFLYVEDQVFAAPAKAKNYEILIVDRIESNIATLEKEDGTMIQINISKLPKKVKEGDVLRCKKGKYTIDRKATKACKKEMQNLLNQLGYL